MTVSRLKPDVPKCWLFAASGVMWSVVGLVMCATGAGWLIGIGVARAIGFELAGLALAVVAFRWGFGSIARKNIRRLRQLPDRGCFFAFQAWKSYLIIGVMIVILLYSVILMRGIRIARNARDRFGAFLATGITVALGLQVCINMGVALGLLPTKGLTLPFLSYGGTSLLINLVAVGIMMNIGARNVQS